MNKILMLAALAAATAAPALAAPTYTAHLTTGYAADFQLRELTSINNHGHIAGNGIRDGRQIGFVNANGTVAEVALEPDADTIIYDVNDAGDVVGALNSTEKLQGFVRRSGTVTTLTDGVDVWSIGYGINNAGTATGVGFPWGPSFAFVHSGNVLTPIGGADLFNGRGTDISESGLVTGDARFDEGDRAFLYDNGEVRNLGTIAGGGSSIGLAVNDAGQVAGRAMRADGVPTLVLWSNGMTIDLGLLDEVYDDDNHAAGINAAGQVVGWNGDWDTGEYRAFLWEKGTLHSLGDLVVGFDGWIFSYAADINDKGQIAAAGYNPDTGEGGFFVLTPNAIPEPAALGLLGLGVLGLAAARRRQG